MNCRRSLPAWRMFNTCQALHIQPASPANAGAMGSSIAGAKAVGSVSMTSLTASASYGASAAEFAHSLS